MEKTKIGLSFGAVGALVYLACLFGGYIPTLLVAGYILLCEDNIWLKRTGVKAVVLMIGFSLINAVIGLIPEFFQVLYSFLRMFDVSFYVEFLDQLANFLYNVVGLTKTVLLLMLAYKALKQQTVVIGFVEKLITKFMN